MQNLNIEHHPLQPFLPKGSQLLMLGSFPPPLKRWSMNFFYPNIQNDMWRIFGWIFFNDKQYFYDESNKCFRQQQLESFLSTKGIALYDTATSIRRLKGNAADEFLEIVERTDIRSLLKEIPQCHAIASTGGKSAGEVCDYFQITTPKVGQCITIPNSNIRFYRMPSSSRSYPFALEKKAEYYHDLFKAEGLL